MVEPDEFIKELIKAMSNSEDIKIGIGAIDSDGKFHNLTEEMSKEDEIEKEEFDDRVEYIFESNGVFKYEILGEIMGIKLGDDKRFIELGFKPKNVESINNNGIITLKVYKNV
jgi:hypothetical protein